MLQNSETEKRGFIQVSIHKGSWRNRVRPTNGYTIEIFRGRFYLGSVDDQSDTNQQLKSMKVQNDDILIWVSLMPHQVEIDVPLITRNGNKPLCQLTLMLAVDKNRTTDFAHHFNQNNDPVEIVKGLITNELQRYARQRPYNELDDDEMRQRVWFSLFGENKQYGLTVKSISRLSVLPDEHIDQRMQVTQVADTNLLRDGLDQARTDQQNAFRRRQDSLDKAHQRTQDLQDSLHQPIKEGLAKRLQRDVSAGKSLYQIREENPDIPNIYALLPDERPIGELAPQERARLAPGTPRNIHAPVRRTTESDLVKDADETLPESLQQKYIVFYLPEFGITVLIVQLSAMQRSKAGMQKSTAMLVCKVDTDDETFAVGDLITMIEGIAVTNIKDLRKTLSEGHLDTLSAQILRGREVLNINIKSFPQVER